MTIPDPKIGAIREQSVVFPAPKTGLPLRIYQGGNCHRLLVSYCRSNNQHNASRLAGVQVRGTKHCDRRQFCIARQQI